MVSSSNQFSEFSSIFKFKEETLILTKSIDKVHPFVKQAG